jgi:hypothetical protein
MRRIGLTGCIAAFLLIGASSASAEPVSLGSRQVTAPAPSVYFSPEILERAESFVVTVTAEPVQALTFRDHISCTRGSESVAYTSPGQTITPPFPTTILPTLAEPDSCWIDVDAEAPFEGAKPGTVKIEVTGNRRPAPTSTPPPPAPPVGVGSLPTVTSVRCEGPSFLKRAHTESHGTGCAMAQRIATEAWNRPDRAGNLVQVSGFACRRAQRGHYVEIHCTKTGANIKVNGWLR